MKLIKKEIEEDYYDRPSLLTEEEVTVAPKQRREKGLRQYYAFRGSTLYRDKVLKKEVGRLEFLKRINVERVMWIHKVLYGADRTIREILVFHAQKGHADSDLMYIYFTSIEFFKAARRTLGVRKAKEVDVLYVEKREAIFSEGRKKKTLSGLNRPSDGDKIE